MAQKHLGMKYIRLLITYSGIKVKKLLHWYFTEYLDVKF